MFLLADPVGAIGIVNWSRFRYQCENLRKYAVGHQSQCVAVSGPFVPVHYEAITFGSAILPKYLLTLNGDGINVF